MQSVDAIYAQQAAIEGFQIFAEALPCIVWIGGDTGKLEWYNQGFGRYTGLTAQTAPHVKTHGFNYEPGSMMVLYTDGLIEFGHDLFDGEHRLLAAAAEAVQCKSENPPAFIANQILGSTTPLDDVAVLTLSFERN